MLSRHIALPIVAAAAAVLAVLLLTRQTPPSQLDAPTGAAVVSASDAPEVALRSADASPTPAAESASIQPAPEVRLDSPAVSRAARLEAAEERARARRSERDKGKYEVTGQLVYDTGTPASGVGMLWIACNDGSTFSGVPMSIDPDGVFRASIQGTIECRDYRIELRMPDGVADPIYVLLREGENDLGTIVVVTSPLVVAGVVVDADGRPKAGARIAVYEARDMKLVGGGSVFARAETDQNGRFAIRSTRGVDEPLVEAIDPTGRRAWVVTHYGDEDCRIVMPESLERVELEVLLPQSLPDSFVAKAILAKDPVMRLGDPEALVRPGRKVVFNAVAPGAYSLRLSGDWLLGEVELAPKVEVFRTPNRTTHELGTFDLRSRLGEVHATVVGDLFIHLSVRRDVRVLEPGGPYQFWIPVEGIGATIFRYPPTVEASEGLPAGMAVKSMRILPGATEL